MELILIVAKEIRTMNGVVNLKPKFKQWNTGFSRPHYLFITTWIMSYDRIRE